MTTTSKPAPLVVLFEANGKAGRQYWWSAQPEAPFIRGEQGHDWDGGFYLEEHAREGIVDRFGNEVANNVWGLQARTPEQEPQVLWPEQVFHCRLEVTIPLDEFSERAFTADYKAPELQQLLDDLQTGLQAKAIPNAAPILLYSPNAESRIQYHNVSHATGTVTFGLPFHMRIRCEVPQTEADIASRILPRVELGPLYPEGASAALVMGLP